MSVLPQSRFVASPLLAITVALSIGIVIEHYVSFTSPQIFTTLIALTIVLALTATATLLALRFRLATGALLCAFIMTGAALGVVANQPVAPNRVARMLSEGTVRTADPVEVTGVVVGEPEPAPL